MINRYARQTLFKMSEKWRIFSTLANVFSTRIIFVNILAYDGCDSLAHRRETTGTSSASAHKLWDMIRIQTVWKSDRIFEEKNSR